MSSRTPLVSANRDPQGAARERRRRGYGPIALSAAAAMLLACGGGGGSGGTGGGGAGGGSSVTSSGAGASGSTSSSSTTTSSASGSGSGGAPSGTPVAINGQLHVCGTQLCNQYDKPIQLRGMSTHGLQWYGLGTCVTEASLDALAYDWNADILRISLYVQEGGYETDPAAFRAQVDQIVDEVVARGMYFILDWHMLDPGDPNENLDLAKEYFTYMTQKHGGKPNVLYEIANEPSGVSWATIKSYANQMIPHIRQVDPDGIIIVGTRAWSSFGVSDGGGPQEVIDDPIAGSDIMYTFHFYAASHQDEYLNALDTASSSLPVFTTEWGSQEYTGDGPNDFASAQKFIDLMAARKISWTSWNYSDDERSGAAFEAGTCPNGPWTGTSPLKPAGAWVRERILTPPDDFPTN
jgi:endoglucanase